MSGPLSQNGYPANNPALVHRILVPGTDVGLTVKRGDAGDLLIHFAAQFDRRVESIDTGRGALDDWGYAERPIRGSATELSNHASGTAIDLNATRHPLGKRSTFSKAQVAEIHQLLAEYGGCIRWGGDYAGRADEMHFEINKPLADVSAAARRIRAQETALMVTPEDAKQIRAIFDDALAAVFRDKDGGLPDIGNARIVRPDGTTTTLANVAQEVHNLTTKGA